MQVIIMTIIFVKIIRPRISYKNSQTEYLVLQNEFCLVSLMDNPLQEVPDHYAVIFGKAGNKKEWGGSVSH